MIAFIGDVHGKYLEYKKICSRYEYTVQVGDMGYDYNPLSTIDSNKHKFIGGNHENWPLIRSYKHFLGRYGFTTINNTSFFFMSGGFSVDWKYRDKMYRIGMWPQTFFPEEELYNYEFVECKKMYEKLKPDILVCHEPPRYLVTRNEKSDDFLRGMGFDPEIFTTKTGEYLNEILDIHMPKVIIHGHMHKSKKYTFKETKVYSLAELEVLEL